MPEMGTGKQAQDVTAMAAATRRIGGRKGHRRAIGLGRSARREKWKSPDSRGFRGGQPWQSNSRIFFLPLINFDLALFGRSAFKKTMKIKLKLGCKVFFFK